MNKKYSVKVLTKPILILLNLILLSFLFNCAEISKKDIVNHRLIEGMSFEYNGIPRNYIVHTPNDYNSKKQYPVLFVFHGAKSNAKDMEKLTGFNSISEKEKFIVVYPYGTTNLSQPAFYWNAIHCCGFAVDEKIDDIGFVKSLIKVIKEDYSVDEKRIYSTGFSNGGMMSIRLACELSREFTAVVAVGGAMFNKQCNPDIPIPIMFIQGKKDIVVPFGGGVGKNSSTKKAKLPALDTFEYWSKMHGCEKEGISENKKTETYLSTNCSSGKEIKMVVVKDEEHTWPIENYPASKEVWKFLKKWIKDPKRTPV